MKEELKSNVLSQIEDNKAKINTIEENKNKLTTNGDALAKLNDIANSSVFEEIDYLVASLETARKFKKVADSNREQSDSLALSNNGEVINQMITGLAEIKDMVTPNLEDSFIGQDCTNTYSIITEMEEVLNGYKVKVEATLAGEVIKEEPTVQTEEVKEEMVTPITATPITATPTVQEDDEMQKVVSVEPVVPANVKEEAPVESRFTGMFQGDNNKANEEPELNEVELHTTSLEDEIEQEVDQEQELANVEEEINEAEKPLLESTEDLTNMINSLQIEDDTMPTITNENVFTPTTNEDVELNNLLETPIEASEEPQLSGIDSGEAQKVVDVAPYLSEEKGMSLGRTA